MSNLTEQSSVIKSIDSATHIENHVSPHCQIDGMSASEYVRTNTLRQIEIARLNATIERQKAEKLAMQVELDKFNLISIELHGSRDKAYKHLESCENSLGSQSERFDELTQKMLNVAEIINNPDNEYVPFHHVAEQIRAALGEVAI